MLTKTAKLICIVIGGRKTPRLTNPVQQYDHELCSMDLWEEPIVS